MSHREQPHDTLPPPQVINPQRCRSCGAEIIWARTQRGSRIPLDAEHKLGFVIEGEKIEGTFQVIQKRIYTTHFATCPNAREHRRANLKP